MASFGYALINKSIMYITMQKKKAPIFKISRSETLETQQVPGYKHKRKTGGLFNGTKRAFTLASTIALVI